MSFQSTFKTYEKKLDTELSKCTFLVDIERQFGAPKTYVSTIFVGIYLLLTYLNFGGIGELLANIASVVIPAYLSLVALETPGKNDDTEFLTYWVVYAFFTILEFWSSLLVNWVPAYWLLKTLFFLYLAFPSTGGANLIYSSVLKPISSKIAQCPVASSLNDNESEKVTKAE